MAKKTKTELAAELGVWKTRHQKAEVLLNAMTEDRNEWRREYQELVSVLSAKEDTILDLRQQRLVLITNIQQDENRIHDLEIVLNIREEEIQKLQSDVFNSFNALETVVENARNAILRPGEGQ